MLSLFCCRWSYWTCTSSELRRPTAIAAAPLTSPLTVNGGRVRSETPRKDAGGGFPRQSLTSFRLPPSLSFPLLLITTRAPLRFSSSLEGDPRSNIFVVQFLLPASALETFECNCGLVFFDRWGGESTHLGVFGCKKCTFVSLPPRFPNNLHTESFSSRFGRVKEFAHDAVKCSSPEWRKCYRAREINVKSTTAFFGMKCHLAGPVMVVSSQVFGMNSDLGSVKTKRKKKRKC